MHEINTKKISVKGSITVLLVMINAVVLQNGLIINKDWYQFLPVSILLLLVTLLAFRRKHL